ncbi:MAG: MFS transporter [Rickettsiales bacterium]|nr:MFS transporter [Rickettsiales bacterium]
MLLRKDILNYSLLALPLAFVGLPLYIHAPDFYVTQHGLSLSTLAALLLGLRVIDAIQDPLIGILSDKFAQKRFSFMLIALVILAVAFYALFTPFTNHVAGWFVVSMLLATTAFSILTVNLNALGALWSSESHQQTRITTTREGITLIGLTCAVVLPPLLQKWMDISQAFSWMSALLLLLSLLGFWRFSGWYKQYASPKPKAAQSPVSFWKNIKNLSPRTRHFYTTYAVSMLASAMPAVLVLFFIRDRLGLEEYTGLFLLTYFLSGVIAMPLWKTLSNNYSPECAWLAAMLLAVISFIGAFLLNEGNLVPYLIICIASGFSLGGDLALPPAILARHMHGQATQNSASSQFAIMTFIAKSALAFAGIIALPILDSMGFTAAASNSNKALFGLSLTYALIPCIIKLGAVLMLWHAINKGEINEKDINLNTDRSGRNAQ